MGFIFFTESIFVFQKETFGAYSEASLVSLLSASGNNAKEICLNLHSGKERLQITSSLSSGGGPSSDYAIEILISLDMQLMKGTKG